MRKRRVLVATSAAIAGALLISACSSGSSTGSGASTSASTSVAATAAAASSATSSSASSGSPAALLPAKYKTSGTIVDASAFDYPPYDYTDSSGKYIGLEPDLLQAVAPILGVKITYSKLAGFASLVPAVSSGRVDMASSSIGVTTARLAQVGYAQYMEMREGLAVQKGNPKNVSVDDLCGHSVAVETGAIEGDEYKTLAAKCASAGKAKLDVQTFSSESAQVLALSSGRVDAVGVGAVTVSEIAKENPALQALTGYVDVGTPPVPIGFAVGPDNPGLAQALAAALAQLQTAGTLKTILAKYGVADDLLSVKYVASTK
jgi:polar amino acid transport system substrate-binding protein